MTFEEFAHKKVVGIPVIYLAGGFVVILGVVAWKLKPSTPPEDTTPVDTGGSAADNAIDPSDYSGLATQGTVIVQQPPPTDVPNSSITTNQEWVSKGVQWLVAQNKTDGTTAQTALSKYINDADRTFAENSLINAWIAEAGPPPDGVSGSGTVAPAPAKKQFDAPPGAHTVTNSNDNSLTAIAQLYYGAGTAANVNLLQFANPSLGTSNGGLTVGTRVNVPAYHDPKYYTVTAAKGETASAIASKNSISLAQLGVLNDPRGGRYAAGYVVGKGASVRVA